MGRRQKMIFPKTEGPVMKIVIEIPKKDIIHITKSYGVGFKEMGVGGLTTCHSIEDTLEEIKKELIFLKTFVKE
ncbi:MAG: hypothetical protein ABIF17_03160 [Patescibacteria group bacterium]